MARRVQEMFWDVHDDQDWRRLLLLLQHSQRAKHLCQGGDVHDWLWIRRVSVPYFFDIFTNLWNIRYASYYYDEYPLPPPALYDYGYGDDYGKEGSGADEGGSGDGVDEGGEDVGDESGYDDVESSDDDLADNGSGSSSSSEELQPPQETW